MQHLPSLARKPQSRLAPRFQVVAAAIAAIVLLPVVADAYTVHGKVGVGWEETLTALGDSGRYAGYGDSSSGVPSIRASGLSLHAYYRQWGFEAIVGGQALMASNQPSRWGGFFSLGTHYNLFRAPQVNLSTGLRLGVGLYRGVNSVSNESAPMRTGFTVEVPLRAVFFLSDHFAFSAAVGPIAAIAGGDGHPLTGAPPDSVEFALFRGGFSGGLGFVVFLR